MWAINALMGQQSPEGVHAVVRDALVYYELNAFMFTDKPEGAPELAHWDLCMPIHQQDGVMTSALFAGPVGNLDGQQQLELQLLAHNALSRLRYLGAMGQNQRGHVTPREAEVLTWVASGKTASEIASITGLSARTVNQHCENAQRRLGTSNRLHTVVEAIRRRWIIV